ncbi:oxidoreductase [Actinocatenispora thailandica]|uniref:Oxidoreductase n=1 Tax=Actinocatenispora thailandica TaxID=227318 RepID=A0A7R7DWV5_9ACTN|nr:SDR family oxidoreductase [Actinocatenispora thailandica]BCJ38852.1 oxidoreductase [Actinocatenispora thailandica]
MNAPTSPVALVTGAGHGIGRATVRKFRALGTRVLAADIDLAAEDLTADPGVLAAHLDVTDPASVEACIAGCVDRLGRLDHLVCTAGGDTGSPPNFLDETDDDWQRLVDLNLYGVVRCIRAAVPRMTSGGAIAVVGSVNGLAAWGGAPYSAAKAGLVNLTQQLAAEFGPRGIRVNLVAPGTVRTRVWDDQPGSPDQMSVLYPLGRIGEPEDIANALAFLCSPDASWITGVTLPVDGGASTGPRHLFGKLPHRTP